MVGSKFDERMQSKENKKKILIWTPSQPHGQIRGEKNLFEHLNINKGKKQEEHFFFENMHKHSQKHELGELFFWQVGN
jgi:hypothetical protein